MKEILRLEHVEYIYQKGTPFEYQALTDVNISINEGEIVGIIGTTGSGKSTLIQHFNGLLIPTSGRVLVGGRDISDKKDGDLKVCFEVGVVFQYPEYQIFEETIYDDIAFGPRNMGLSGEEVEERVKTAMEWMQLDYDSFRERSPFGLSGGEMRRVALAGIMAMQPRVLVLDEPTAGLDPRGCIELRERLLALHRERNMTLVMVTHEMGEIARMATHLIVINKGRVAADGSPDEIFSKTDWIREIGLGVPPSMELLRRLKVEGFDISTNILDIEGVAAEIVRYGEKFQVLKN